MDKKIYTTEKRFCEECGKETIRDATYLCMIKGGQEVGKVKNGDDCRECIARSHKKAIEGNPGIK